MTATGTTAIETINPLAEIPAFEQVFHQFNAPLCFFARRWVHDLAVAQDIVTDVFVKLWQKRTDFKTLYSIKAFLYISTRNACINHTQQAKYQARVREAIRQQSGDRESNGLNEVIYAEVLRQVNAIVERLPAKCREVITLSYSAGLNCHEIAHKMQVSVHTVRNQKNRGVHLIKSRFCYTGIEEDIYYNNN